MAKEPHDSQGDVKIVNWVRVAALGLALLIQPAAAQTAVSDLEGIWVVERTYAPVLRGELEVMRDGDLWRGAIGGEHAEARRENGAVRLSFGNHGAFRGALGRNGALSGVWIQPNSDAEERDDPTAASQSFASELTFTRNGRNWRAQVRPLDGRFTLYLRVFRDADGNLIGAFRNHEINSNGRASHFRLRKTGPALSFLAPFDDGHNKSRLSRLITPPAPSVVNVDAIHTEGELPTAQRDDGFWRGA